jgi:hypothetical protein
MNLRPWAYVLVGIALAAVLIGCGSGKRAFAIQEVCLKNAEDLSAFTREMQLIAQSERAKFLDRSANTQRELDTTGHPVEGARTRPVVNMGFYRRDGVGLTVTNLGLPGYQVAVGFSEGSNSADAHRLAQMVMSKLAEHWHVETVPSPATSGAFPMANCNDDEPLPPPPRS